MDRMPMAHTGDAGPLVQRIEMDAAHDPIAIAQRHEGFSPLDVLGVQLEGLVESLGDKVPEFLRGR